MSAELAAAPAARVGWARALVAAYAFMALAACARSAVQIATRFETAPLAFSLSALSGAIYLLATFGLARGGERGRRVAAFACGIELAAVLTVGTWSLLDPALFPEPTVWSGYGSGYGYFPLVLPLLGLLWLRRSRPPSPLRG